MSVLKSESGRASANFVYPALCWLLFWVLIWPCYGHAQTGGEGVPYRISYAPSKTGGVLLFTGAKHFLAVDIVSAHIQTTEQPNYLLVDNMVVQVSMVPLPNGVEGSVLAIPRQKEALTGYVDYEMDYFQKEVRLSTSLLKQEWISIKGRTFLLWTFHVAPQAGQSKGTSTITDQLYLSVLWHEQVVDLNCAVFDRKDMAKARAMLLQMADSMRAGPGNK
jgi:hypothetical protein